MSMHTEDGKEIVIVDHIYERGGISVSPITKAQLVAALIAEGGEIVEMNPCCTASDGRAMMSPKGDVVSGNGECAEFLLPPGSYLVYGPIPVESAEAKETP